MVDLTPRRATLQWPSLLTAATGYYELWYKSVRTHATGTLQKLSGDSSSVELTDLVPDTPYTVVLLPVSNQRPFKALSVNFSTPSGKRILSFAVWVSSGPAGHRLAPSLAAEVLGPNVVSVSDFGPHHIRVEWGPLQVAQVLRYMVEYGAIPSGRVHTLTLHGQQNSALLTGLEPATQYLVTVSALYADGKERAMSVRACTEEGMLVKKDVCWFLSPFAF